MSTSDLLIYLTPVMTGLIGWFTNWVAVKMLFKPERPVKILFFTLQGIFPKRQNKLAEKIGRMVADELLTSHDIRQRVLSQENIDTFIVFVEEKIDHYLLSEFPRKYPITSVFFGKSRREQIKIDLLQQVHVLAPEIIEKVMSELEEKINVEEIITDKVAALSPDKLEQLINGILKKEFRFIEWSGGILGFIVGVIQVLFIIILK